MIKFLWESDVKMPEFPALEGDIETDVLVIGGGLSGILCAHTLQEREIDCLIVEGRTIASGTTKGTTAVVTAQHGNIYTRLVKLFGRDTAGEYLNANLEAVNAFRKLADVYDFDFCDKPSFVYSMDDERSQKVEAAVVRELGFPAEFTKYTDLPMDIAGAVKFPDMAQIHPLKLIAALAGELNIREHTYVKKVKGNEAITDRGTIKANKIIIASHYPFINTRGLYSLKLYQKRSFVIALEGAVQLEGTYTAAAPRGIYMRNYGDLLIVGGGDHRTAAETDGFRMVRKFAEGKFPQACEKYCWAAQDCMALDNMPYIGRYSRSTPDMFVITGFNEWGMTSSMVAASIIADMITGRKNKYEDIFAPDRSMARIQLLANAGEYIGNLLKPGAKRCSHLGCTLRENKDEGTWDCPCHGSRFTDEGRLIDNPAMRDIRF